MTEKTSYIIRNIWFFIGYTIMLFVLIAGTIGCLMNDLPWILSIILIWCDIVAILALINRIQDIKRKLKQFKK